MSTAEGCRVSIIWFLLFSSLLHANCCWIQKDGYTWYPKKHASHPGFLKTLASDWEIIPPKVLFILFQLVPPQWDHIFLVYFYRVYFLIGQRSSAMTPLEIQCSSWDLLALTSYPLYGFQGKPPLTPTKPTGSDPKFNAINRKLPFISWISFVSSVKSSVIQLVDSVGCT